MNCWKLTFFIFITLLSSAKSMDISSAGANHFIHKILENECHCVHEYAEGKIFLIPSKITFSADGPMLSVNDHETILLPLIQINKQGWFLEHRFSFPGNMEPRPSKTRICCTCNGPVDGRRKCMNSDCQFFGFAVDTVIGF